MHIIAYAGTWLEEEKATHLTLWKVMKFLYHLFPILTVDYRLQPCGLDIVTLSLSLSLVKVEKSNSPPLTEATPLYFL